MKRHLSDLTTDSNDAKSSIMSEVDKICGVSDKDNVPPTETITEYRNDELDITFFENQFEDYCSDNMKEDPPFDIKAVSSHPIIADVSKPNQPNHPLPTDVFGDHPKNWQEIEGSTRFDNDSGLWLRAKVLNGHTATYLKKHSPNTIQ